MNKPDDSVKKIDLESVQSLIIFLVVIIWLLSGFLLWKSPDKIPMFFSRPYGREQLVSSWWILLYPILSVLVYFVGNYVKNKFKSSQISTSMAIWINLGSVTLLLLSEIFITTLIF